LRCPIIKPVKGNYAACQKPDRCPCWRSPATSADAGRHEPDGTGAKIGLTFQQIQKYEKGANRIGAGRLYQFADILGVPPSFFFDGLSNVEAANHDPAQTSMLSRDAMELLRAYNGIQNDTVRRRVLALVKSMSIEPDGRDTGEE